MIRFNELKTGVWFDVQLLRKLNEDGVVDLLIKSWNPEKDEFQYHTKRDVTVTKYKKNDDIRIWFDVNMDYFKGRPVAFSIPARFIPEGDSQALIKFSLEYELFIAKGNEEPHNDRG